MRTGEGLRAMTPVDIEKIRREEVGPQDFTAEIVHPDWHEVFVTEHGHSSGAPVQILHLGCNLHCGDEA